jgi:hypothetical protein
MDKFLPMSSPNFQILVVSFKHQLKNRGYVSSIFAVKENNVYYYIQDSCKGQ